MAKQSVQKRAEHALEKVRKMIEEITSWKGTRPTVVRVNHGDYLALVECDKLNAYPGVEIKPG